MATQAQVLANRANAQKSTGPRTAEGKTKVAQNAVQHGLLARAAVLQGEDPEEFAEFREHLLEELDADGTQEVILAERIVSLTWRLQRAARNQNAAFEVLYDHQAAFAPKRSTGSDRDESADNWRTLGQTLVTDFANERVLERLLVYERRIESSLYRTTAELRRLRRERGAGAVPSRGTKPISEGVSSWKCQGSREESQESSPPGLPTSNFALQTADEPPCGKTCQTKPIPLGPKVGQVPCGVEVMADSAPDGLGETKANCSEQGRCEAVVCWAGGPTATQPCG